MWIVRVFGNVIGVNFRFNTQTIAKKYGWTGSVRNMPDQSVEITIDGSYETADLLIKELKKLGFTTIDSVKFTEKPGNTHLSSFEIKK